MLNVRDLGSIRRMVSLEILDTSSELWKVKHQCGRYTSQVAKKPSAKTTDMRQFNVSQMLASHPYKHNKLRRVPSGNWSGRRGFSTREHTSTREHRNVRYDKGDLGNHSRYRMASNGPAGPHCPLQRLEIKALNLFSAVAKRFEQTAGAPKTLHRTPSRLSKRDLHSLNRQTPLTPPVRSTTL